MTEQRSPAVMENLQLSRVGKVKLQKMKKMLILNSTVSGMDKHSVLAMSSSTSTDGGSKSDVLMGKCRLSRLSGRMLSTIQDSKMN